MWIFFVKTDPSCLQHCFQNSIEWYSMSKLLNRRLSCLFSSRIQFLSNDNFPPFSRKLLSLNELPPNLRMRTLSRWVSTTQGPFWLRCESWYRVKLEKLSYQKLFKEFMFNLLTWKIVREWNILLKSILPICSFLFQALAGKNRNISYQKSF